MPKVSVLLPVRNGEKYLRDALTSILEQTFHDFELIVVNDGSTDGTAAILDGYADARIRRIDHESGYGLSPSLNEAFRQSQGEYIARMDADDIAYPSRLEKQVALLDRRPEIVLCSTNLVEIDPDGKTRLSRRWPPRDPRPLEWLFLFETPVAHPTVMFRREAIPAGTDPYRLVSAEDHDLWTRLILRGRVQRLPEILLKYRVHPGSTYLSTRIDCLDESIRSSTALAAAVGVRDAYFAELSEFYLSRRKYPRDPSLEPSRVRRAWTDRIRALRDRWNWSAREERAALRDIDHRIFKNLVLEKRWRQLLHDFVRHPLATIRSALYFIGRRYQGGLP